MFGLFWRRGGGDLEKGCYSNVEGSKLTQRIDPVIKAN